MKIAVIHSIYKPYVRGGAEVVVENIVQGLKNSGDDVFVITVGYKNELQIIDGVRVYRIKPFNLFNFLNINSKPVWLRLPWHIMDMFNDVQTWRVYKVLSQEKPDLVLTHNLKGLGYYIPWLLRIMKIKHVQTVHDMQLIHPSGLLGDGQKISWPVAIYAWLNKKLFKSIESVIFPSQYIKKVYEAYGFFKSAESLVLGNPILIPPLPRGGRGGVIQTFDQPPPAPPCLPDRQASKGGDLQDSPPALSSKGGELQILFLGQVEEYKGIYDLIEAVGKIKSDFVLHIVGDGSALDNAKKMTKADYRFKFHGRLSHLELENKIWPQIDLLINPTKVSESFGMVVLEAMVHGVPTLATNIGAIPELINEGQTGWLFEAGNIAELGSKIEFIAKNICAFESIGLLAQAKAKEYNIESYLNKLIEFAKIRTI